MVEGARPSPSRPGILQGGFSPGYFIWILDRRNVSMPAPILPSIYAARSAGRLGVISVHVFYSFKINQTLETQGLLPLIEIDSFARRQRFPEEIYVQTQFD